MTRRLVLQSSESDPGAVWISSEAGSRLLRPPLARNHKKIIEETKEMKYHDTIEVK